MDQGDPVRKQEAHAPSEERLAGKEGERERKKKRRKNPVSVQGTKDHGRMIEAPRQKTKRITVRRCGVRVAGAALGRGENGFSPVSSDDNEQVGKLCAAKKRWFSSFSSASISREAYGRESVTSRAAVETSVYLWECVRGSSSVAQPTEQGETTGHVAHLG